MASILGSQPTRQPLLKLPLSSTIFQSRPFQCDAPLMQHSALNFEAIQSKVHMAQILILQISTTAPTTAKMTWTESCMASLMSSLLRKQKDENTTQDGKPKPPRHPSSRPGSSTGSSKHLLLAHQHITYLPYQYKVCHSTFHWSFSTPRALPNLNLVHDMHDTLYNTLRFSHVALYYVRT